MAGRLIKITKPAGEMESGDYNAPAPEAAALRADSHRLHQIVSNRHRGKKEKKFESRPPSIS